MKKSSRRKLLTGLCLTMLAFTPNIATATEGQTAANGSASSEVYGTGNTATSIGASVEGGSQNVAVGSSLQIINGSSNSVDGVGGLVIGGTGNTSIGYNAQTIDGNNLQSSGFGAISGRGDFNTAIGTQAYAGGLSTEQRSHYNTAIGYGATAVGGESVAIGTNAYVTPSAYGSVAIGAGSVAQESGTVSVGQPGYERRIMNVAGGIYDTDAANMGQLRTVDAKVDRVGASAAAFSALAPLPYDPKEPTQYSAGIGTYNGTAAFAVGVYHYTQHDVMLNAAIGISNNGWEKQARVGISWRTGAAKRKELTPAIEAKETLDDRVKKILAELDKIE